MAHTELLVPAQSGDGIKGIHGEIARETVNKFPGAEILPAGTHAGIPPGADSLMLLRFPETCLFGEGDEFLRKTLHRFAANSGLFQNMPFSGGFGLFTAAGDVDMDFFLGHKDRGAGFLADLL